MNFCVLTLGCKVNAYESEFIKEKFEEFGYKSTSLDDKPDVIVVNTCSVTNQSDAKSRHMIRLSRKKSPQAIIVACGCSAQNHKEELLTIGADIVLGTKDKSKIVEYVANYRKVPEKVGKFYDMKEVEFERMFLKSEKDKTRAFVKIQDGCNNFCSYCIIPYLRGNIRSKDIDLAVQEIDDLVAMGHKEIVLTGIHTGSYGAKEDYDLVDLIRRISANPNLKRIRISSIEVTELSEKFMEELRNNPLICDHLHIPLQSGSDVVLEKMNRKYDTAFYAAKIREIRDIRPDISITTDLIVGFPYENDEEFRMTLSFLEKIRFTKIHTFPFSLRSGTKAEEMKEHFVDEKVKKERVHEVLKLSQEMEKEYYSKFLNKKLSIIVETAKDDKIVGHASNYIPVEIEEKIAPGDIVDVIVDKVDNFGVKGHVVGID